MTPENKKIKIIAEDILFDAIMLRRDYLDEYCESREIKYDNELQKMVNRIAKQLGNKLGFIVK